MILGKYRTYEDYIWNSPEWQETRKGALARAGNKCQLCSERQRLDVHHNCYDRLGYEIPEDLFVVCRPCHTRHHAFFKPIPEQYRNKISPSAKLPDDLFSKVAMVRPDIVEQGAAAILSEAIAIDRAWEQIAIASKAWTRCALFGMHKTEFGNVKFWCEPDAENRVTYKLILSGLECSSPYPSFRKNATDEQKIESLCECFLRGVSLLIGKLRPKPNDDTFIYPLRSVVSGTRGDCSKGETAAVFYHDLECGHRIESLDYNPGAYGPHRRRCRLCKPKNSKES